MSYCNCNEIHHNIPWNCNRTRKHLHHLWGQNINQCLTFSLSHTHTGCTFINTKQSKRLYSPLTQWLQWNRSVMQSSSKVCWVQVFYLRCILNTLDYHSIVTCYCMDLGTGDVFLFFYNIFHNVKAARKQINKIKTKMQMRINNSIKHTDSCWNSKPNRLIIIIKLAI